jgi:hypothetical protein
MKKIVLIALLIALLGVGGFLFYKSQDQYDASKYSASISEGFKRGSMINFKLPDQFDKDVALDSSTQKLIVVFNKEQGHMVNEFLATKPKDFLSSHGALLMADISKMPVVIRNTFALPSLKKSGYPTVLIYDAQIGNVFKNPQKAEMVHIISLSNNRVLEVQYAATSQDLEKFLK